VREKGIYHLLHNKFKELMEMMPNDLDLKFEYRLFKGDDSWRLECNSCKGTIQDLGQVKSKMSKKPKIGGKLSKNPIKLEMMDLKKKYDVTNM
jgi:hypothetical protein